MHAVFYCCARIQFFHSSNSFLSRAAITERCQMSPCEKSSCSMQQAWPPVSHKISVPAA